MSHSPYFNWIRCKISSLKHKQNVKIGTQGIIYQAIYIKKINSNDLVKKNKKLGLSANDQMK